MATTTTTDQTTQAPQSAANGIGGIAAGLAPKIDQAKAFAKARPWATGTLAAVLGVALLNTLRGRQ